MAANSIKEILIRNEFTGRRGVLEATGTVHQRHMDTFSGENIGPEEKLEVPGIISVYSHPSVCVRPRRGCDLRSCTGFNRSEFAAMKKLPRLVVSFFAMVLVTCVTNAQTSPVQPPPPQAAGAVPPKPALPKWDVKIEVLIADVPQPAALDLLPDLHDSGKIEGATARILDAIRGGKARLVGYPVIETADGERAVSETVSEVRYPTTFSPLPHSEQGCADGPKPPPVPGPGDTAFPSGFETRNVGTTIEVESAVTANGNWIHINMVPQRVIQTGTAWFAHGVHEPQFFTSKLTISPVVRNGQKTLVGFHALPDGTAEIFILQAWATVVK